MKNIRTDLALEAAQLCDKSFNIEGADIKEKNIDGVIVTDVKIKTEFAAERIGKPVGEYITIEASGIKDGDEEICQKTEKILTKELTKLVDPKKNKKILVVGLGNWNITPDALGPKVAGAIYVTRHLFETKSIDKESGICSVSAISPGVLGITGIETGEIIKGIVKHSSPDIIIAVDALASRSIERVSTTIQLSDTGIVPGSGIGNSRNGITEKEMGVPVIAIGVPTVVDAATVASDSIELLTEAVGANSGKDSQLYRLLKSFDDSNRYALIKEVLTPFVGNLIVTPKEVDNIIDNISAIIADSINHTLLYTNYDSINNRY